MISMQAAANYTGQSGHGEHSASQSAVSCVPWLGGIGSQAFQQSASLCNPLKLLSVDDSSRVPATVKQMGLLLQQCSSKQGACQSQSDGEGGQLGTTRKQALSIQYGFDSSNRQEQRHQQSTVTVIPSAAVDYLMPQTQLELGHSVAHVAYPYADPCFRGIVAAFGAQSMIHPHLLGGQQARIALPLEMTEEEPVYVNAKQYHGILRRRQSRAKAELENKLVKVRKPYLHESRHRHAMRRLRGCGGRFLNTKKLDESKVNNETDNRKGSKGQSIHAGSSSGSETFQSESGNIIFLQEVQGTSAISGSEVTSMAQSYTNANNLLCSDNNGMYINSYQHQHFHLSAFHPLSSGWDGDTGQGGVMLSNGLQQRAVAI